MDSMQHFNNTRQQMNSVLQKIRVFTMQVGVTDFTELVTEAMQVLEREQFEVMIVGEFSNGKSTLINALLQDEVLPASSIPTTALLNKISYAPQEHYEMVYSTGKKEVLSREKFTEYVAYPVEQAKEGLTGKFVQKVKDQLGKPTHMEIQYPTDICRDNIVLIDSPGTNDMDEERVKITDSYIPKSDAAIFLLNASKIFSASEKAFLQRILDADIHKIFFVINFKDLLKTEEQFESVRKVVLENMPEGLAAPKIHFVSAKDALMYFTHKDMDLSTMNIRQLRRLEQRLPYEETGMIEFEQHLKEFLTYDRGLEKLRKPSQVALRVLNDIHNQFIRYEMQTLQMSIQNVEQHVNSIELDLKKVEQSLKSSVKIIQKHAVEKKQQIERWYKSALADLSRVANNVLEQGVQDKLYPENIKDQISLATASKEKDIQQMLNQKVQQMVKELFSSESNAIQSELSRVSSNILPKTIEHASWGEVIIRKEETSSTVENVSVGAAVVGGLAVLFTGGIVGWGLLGAGIAGAAVSTYVNRESDTSMYGRLRSQVKDRYGNSASINVKMLTKSLDSVVDQAVSLFEKEVHTKITQEKQRTKILIRNQNLAQGELGQKMETLQANSATCQLLMKEVQNILTTFKSSTKGVVVS